MVRIPRLSYPFSGTYDISYGFGERSDDTTIRKQYAAWGLAGHAGVDFALPAGTDVVAIADGNVIQAGENGYFGLSVMIHHAWGDSLYAHLQKTNVRVGQPVSKGAVIGCSGETGFVTGPHLHLGIKPDRCNKDNGYAGYIDPMPYLWRRKRTVAGKKK